MSLHKIAAFLAFIVFSGLVNGLRRSIAPTLDTPYYKPDNSIFGSTGVFGSSKAINGAATTTNNVQGNQGTQSANITNSMGVANVQTNNQINTVVNAPIENLNKP